MSNNNAKPATQNGVSQSNDKSLIESIENNLIEILNKNPKKFQEILEKANGQFKSKFPKEYYTAKVDDYFNSFETVDNWINNCFDDVRNYVKVISYPLFVYFFLDMITKGLWSQCIHNLNKFKCS